MLGFSFSDKAYYFRKRITKHTKAFIGIPPSSPTFPQIRWRRKPRKSNKSLLYDIASWKEWNEGITWLYYLRFKDQGLFQQAHNPIKVFFLLSNPGTTQPIVCYLRGVWTRRVIQVKFGGDYLWVTFALKTNKLVKHLTCIHSYWPKQQALTTIRRSRRIK